MNSKHILDINQIVLNPDSKGEKMDICDLEIFIPKAPAKKDIASSSSKKEDQVWFRDEICDNWETLEADDLHEFIEREYFRRLHGHWFMNNGEPTYITGTHYFYLTWCKMDVGFPDYRDRDRRFFLFWEACIVDPRCFGIVMAKHRREGASYKGACILLDMIMLRKESLGGITSKTGSDAKTLFTDKLIPMFRKLPSFFQPLVDGTDNPKSKLSFSKPGERITKKNQRVKKSEALNSSIDWRNTVENSYDSTKMKAYLCDEGGKWDDADLLKHWSIVSPCLTEGRKIVGKCFMPSTVNEMTSKGASNFKKIWDGANVNERNANGRTVSGLYKYMTPAYDGLEGFIDKYGMSVINDPKEPVEGIDGDMIEIGAKTYLMNERESRSGDAVKLSEYVRQYPFNEDEAFRVDGDNCKFDTMKLYQQLEYLQSLPEKITQPGNLVWKGGQKDTEVVWHPDRHGRWRLAYGPDNSDGSNVRRVGKLLSPARKTEFVSACDPIDHSKTTDGRGSLAASHVFRKFSMNSADLSNAFVAEYHARPGKVEEFYEDMIKQSIFFGCEILVENNKIGLINYMRLRGYDKFLMRRPDSTRTAYSKNQETPGIPTAGAVVINAITDYTQSYIYDFVGYNEQTGEIGNMYFERTLKDWLKFEPDNRTKYDLSVSAGLCLIAASQHVKIKKEVVRTGPLVRKFNNSGNISKAL